MNDLSEVEMEYLSMIATNDSEYDKMVFARKSAHTKSNGFQGCVNLGRGCDFTGFYLCTYSPEGLCSDCECKTFPSRYTWCVFCGGRLPLSIGPACLSCTGNCKDWIVRSTTVIQDPDVEQRDEWGVKIHVKIWAHSLFTRYARLKMQFPPRNGELARLTSSKWPGFTTEGGGQVIPTDLKLEITVQGKMPWGSEGIPLLEDALKRADINILSTVQLHN